MYNISHNLNQVRPPLENAALASQRNADDILLLAVSKTKPVSAIQEAYSAGQRDFGENYAQELADKCSALQGLDIRWHFIGPIQSNKTKIVAECADWVHSIDRFKTAKRLNDQRPSHLAPIQACIQVNIDNEPTKSGIPPDALAELYQQMQALPNLKLRGLMAIPNQQHTPTSFRRLRELAQAYGLTTLSMGMSRDMDAAIAAGSSIIRIGTAIFGARADASNTTNGFEQQ